MGQRLQTKPKPPANTCSPSGTAGRATGGFSFRRKSQRSQQAGRCRPKAGAALRLQAPVTTPSADLTHHRVAPAHQPRHTRLSTPARHTSPVHQPRHTDPSTPALAHQPRTPAPAHRPQHTGWSQSLLVTAATRSDSSTRQTRGRDPPGRRQGESGSSLTLWPGGEPRPFPGTRAPGRREADQRAQHSQEGTQRTGSCWGAPGSTLAWAVPSLSAPPRPSLSLRIC